MSASPLVIAIQHRLRLAGYSDLSSPFRVAGVEFAFTAVMRGRDGRALDLILMVDTTTGDFGDRDADRVRQRVEALSRALDVTGSRYVVTAILAGAVLAAGIESLSETCRVLQVEDIAVTSEGKPVDALAERQLDDRVRVLLPLSLPAPVGTPQGGAVPAMDQLVRALPSAAGRALVARLIAASDEGEEAVTDSIAAIIDDAFADESGGTPA